MVRTADGLSGLVECIFTLTGACITATTAATAALGVVITTNVSSITTRSQLFLSNCSFMQTSQVK